MANDQIFNSSDSGDDALKEISHTEDCNACLHASALICTKDRSDMLPNAVESVLKASCNIEELIVLDQSSDDRAFNSLAPYFSDPRLKYVRDNNVGKSRALNLGISLSKCDIVAITDDDCIVSEEWPNHLIESFQNHPSVAVAYGNVLPASHDPKQGFIPICIIKKEILIKHAWEKIRESGIGANMALRRNVIIDIGGFDLELGPGARFAACEDWDISLRALLFGYQIINVTGSPVIHYGFRNWDDASKLIRKTFYGIGASYVKSIRCNRPMGYIAYFYQLFHECLFYTIKRTILNQEPYGYGRIINFIKGSIDGLCHPISYRNLVYTTQHNLNQ